MKRRIYHVVWRNEQWHVRRARARRSTAMFDLKKDACYCAAILGTRAKFSELVIHGKNGKIQCEYVYEGEPRRTSG